MVLFLICMIFPCQVVEVSAVLRSLNHENAHLVLNGINCGWSLFEAERKQHEKNPNFQLSIFSTVQRLHFGRMNHVCSLIKRLMCNAVVEQTELNNNLINTTVSEMER